MSLSLGQRQALVVGAGLVALLGAAGITEAHVFHQPSTLKYAVTIIGPLFIGSLFMSRDPVSLVAALLIFAAPFAGFSMTFKNTHVPLLAPIAVVAAAVAVVSEREPGRRSTLAFAGGLALVLFLLPVIESAKLSDTLAVLASLFLAAYFASLASSSERRFLTLAWAFVASAAVQAALAVWENTTGHRLNLYGTAGAQTFGANYFFGYIGGKTRPPGAFYDPISLGNMLAIAVPLCAGLAIHYGRSRRWVQMALALLAAALIVTGLEITLSRMSWLGAVIGLVVAAALLPPAQRRAVLPGLVLVIGIAAVLGLFGGSSPVIERLGSITHPLNETGTGNEDVLRVDVWGQAVSVAQRHPIAGVGFGGLVKILSSQFAPAGLQSQAQSTYLQVAAEAGLLGVAGLLAVLYAAVNDLGRFFRTDRLWAAILAGSFVAMLVCWSTDVTVRYSGVAVYMGMLFGMIAGSSRRASGSADARPASGMRRSPSAIRPIELHH
jgi:O-Antigen ligase